MVVEGRFTAVVTRSTGSWYEVRTAEGEIFSARLRGRLRLAGSRATNPVVVGDAVECSIEAIGGSSGAGAGGGAGSGAGSGASSDQSAKEVWIEAIGPRRNYIIRRASNLSRESHIIAANVDQALVVATLASPATPTEFIDRFLVTCEAYGVPATILLNKVDLVLATDGGEEAMERFAAIYRGAGYRVIFASARTGLGVEEVREFLRGRTTLVSGNSGVGKSTLVGAVSPGLEIRVGEVSRSHGKGMHTTTFSQMYLLDGLPNTDIASDGAGSDSGSGSTSSGGGGYIIDTPGIKGFGLIDISADELCRYFPDLMRFSSDCQYYNCTHTHEPGCAVVRAVEEGAIADERYMSYLKMLEEDGKYRK
ncbi:MAG: ribosome small subunit-dependent GTPase A [Alistipes sp.]|jgi:ribosome biogenesis GTPase|nr:ribosome small subunit-dependent GTPase A [Alistipes sp.]